MFTLLNLQIFMFAFLFCKFLHFPNHLFALNNFDKFILIYEIPSAVRLQSQE